MKSGLGILVVAIVMVCVGAVASADGRTAYISNYGTGKGGFNTLTVADLVKDFEGFDVSPDGNQLWTASPRGKIVIVDTVKKTVASSSPGCSPLRAARQATSSSTTPPRALKSSASMPAATRMVLRGSPNLESLRVTWLVGLLSRQEIGR